MYVVCIVLAFICTGLTACLLDDVFLSVYVIVCTRMYPLVLYVALIECACGILSV